MCSRLSEGPDNHVHSVSPSDLKKKKIVCFVWIFPRRVPLAMRRFDAAAREGRTVEAALL